MCYQTCLSYNQLTSLPGHISKLEAALDRVHPPPITGANRQNGAENANLTAGDLRETREREERSAAVRKTVGVQIRIGKGLVTLAAREYEKAGREFGEISEEGGLGEWEGQVEVNDFSHMGRTDAGCRQYRQQTSQS
jgi:COP9 signalosome complex subunit 1